MINDQEIKKGKDCIKKTFFIEAKCLEKGADVIDPEQFICAVDFLTKAERIAACGCGHSGIACRHFVHLMCCIERPARFLAPSDAVHGGLGYLKEGDVMLLVSRGGETEELFPVLDICQAKKVTIITVTEQINSPLAKASNVVLQEYINRETDKYNCQGTTSTIFACAIFHALQEMLIEKTNFQEEEFALIHPGGAVGKRLR